MANTLVQFRTDETERAEATQILDQLGLDMPSYLECVSPDWSGIGASLSV